MKARFDQLFAESCCKKEWSVLNNSIVCTHLLKSNEGKLWMRPPASYNDVLISY